MSDIYHITRERVVDIYDTRSIRKYARTFRAFFNTTNSFGLVFFVYLLPRVKLGSHTKTILQRKDGIYGKYY